MASKDVAQKDASTEVAMLDKAVVAQFSQMAMLIPEPDDNASSRIMATILSATTWEELNEPWDIQKAKDLAGKPQVIYGATRHPSDFREGLGIFLVLDCVDAQTGERHTIPTSSMSILGQIARAYMIGAMPLIAEFVIAQRASRKGYYPQHLRVLGTKASPSQASDGAAQA